MLRSRASSRLSVARCSRAADRSRSRSSRHVCGACRRRRGQVSEIPSRSVHARRHDDDSGQSCAPHRGASAPTCRRPSRVALSPAVARLRRGLASVAVTAPTPLVAARPDAIARRRPALRRVRGRCTTPVRSAAAGSCVARATTISCPSRSSASPGVPACPSRTLAVARTVDHAAARRSSAPSSQDGAPRRFRLERWVRWAPRTPRRPRPGIARRPLRHGCHRPAVHGGGRWSVPGARGRSSRGESSSVFLSFGSRRSRVQFEVQRTIVALGLEIRSLTRDFSDYVGAGVLGGTSHLYHLVVATDASIGESLYTGGRSILSKGGLESAGRCQRLTRRRGGDDRGEGPSCAVTTTLLNGYPTSYARDAIPSIERLLRRTDRLDSRADRVRTGEYFSAASRENSGYGAFSRSRASTFVCHVRTSARGPTLSSSANAHRGTRTSSSHSHSSAPPVSPAETDAAKARRQLQLAYSRPANRHRSRPRRPRVPPRRVDPSRESPSPRSREAPTAIMPSSEHGRA